MAYPLGANIFITGANRGIGLGIVKEILKIGGAKNIFAGCRNPKEAKDLDAVSKSNGAVKLVKIDVSSEESVRNAAAEVDRIVGKEGLNLLVNNSGILEKEGVSPQEPKKDAFMRQFEVNSVGVVLTTAAFLPMLKKASASGQPSRVATISSILGCISQLVPLSMAPNKCVAYGMSKAAVNYYTKALAVDEPAIVAVAFHPGWVQTDMGGPNAMVTVEDSTSGIVKKMCALGKEDSGKFIDYQGKELTP